MSNDRRARGREGERLAERHLRARGYRVFERNVHLRRGEIDLVALDRDTLCIVEVRLRSSHAFGSAAESVDRAKRRRLRQAAALLLARGGLPRHASVRFDVVAIDARHDPPSIELIRDAFSGD